MASLEAELARFEAELAGTNGVQQPLHGLPGPSYHPGPNTLPPPPPFPGSGGANISSSLQAPQASLLSPPSQLPPLPQQAAPAYAAPGAAQLPPPPAAYTAQPYVSQPPQQSYALPQPIAQQPMPSNYYAAPQYPQYAPATSGAGPVYASAAGSVAGAHSQHDVAGVKAALEREANEKKKKPPAMPRAAGGQKWWDPTLTEWPENDFRIFVGDLGNEVNDDVLAKAFQKFNTFAKAKVVRNKHTNKTKGFGFVSFTDTVEGAKALREMDGKYIGNRPCKLRKSTWDERTNTQALQKKRKGGHGHDGKPVLNMKKHVGVLHR